MSKMFALALFVHLLAVVVWIGGMAFAYFCLRPAAGALEPPARLPLWDGALTRFFGWVGGAVLAILLSGGWLLAQFGGMRAVWPLHAMAGLGVAMMLIFGHARFAELPRLRRGVQAQDWAAAGRALGRLRRLVALNLALGVVAIGMAALSRGL